MSAPKSQRCKNCRYSLPTEEVVNGENVALCVRNPPQVVEIQRDGSGQGASISRMPRIGVNSWCGEWSPENPETVEEGAAKLARFVLLGDMVAARALADKLRED